MTACSIDGCDKGGKLVRGWCSTHYQRWQAHGDPEKLLYRPSINERFQASVRCDPNGCWTWIGTIARTGYGTFSAHSKTHVAHRWTYERLIGPIPAGFHLDHLCRNRACVNPQHLDIVTPRENVMRGMSPSAVIRRQAICKRGHELVGENIYVPPKKPQHRQCRTCRAERARVANARKQAA
jgi:hypothetical protein